MDHFCAICNSVFLPNNGDKDAEAAWTETVVTSCGHVFHRDCVTIQARLEGATCCICHASLREGNKFKKVFIEYEEDERDVLIQAEVTSATAMDKAALERDRRVEPLQRRLDILKEEQVYNQVYIEKLDNQLAVMRQMYRMQVERMQEIQKRTDGEVLEIKRDAPV